MPGPVIVDIEYGAVRPLAVPEKRRSTIQVVAIAACLAACICVAALGAPERAPGSLEETVEITKEDVAAAEQKAKDNLESHPEQQAGEIRGSRPTAAEEAAAIIGEGSGAFIKNVDTPYYKVEGPHNNIATVAGLIIDNANKAGVDITGAGGADSYVNLVRGEGASAAQLTGSLPNFHAESRYITSGVVGNFEKSIEDWPTTAFAGGKLPARTVANGIIDSVIADHDNVDCTGVVGADGVHNTGTPPCPEPIKVIKE